MLFLLQLLPSYVLDDIIERKLDPCCSNDTTKGWNYLNNKSLRDPKSRQRGFMVAHTVQALEFDKSLTVRQFIDER